MLYLDQLFIFFHLMAEQKRYVVWEGKEQGIFASRDEVKSLVLGVKGAKYKAFPTPQLAQEALTAGREPYYQTQKKPDLQTLPFVKTSIAVDAACSSATGVMEYQGIDLVSGQQIFHAYFPQGTNNIGEFLAIVHGLSWLEKEKKTDYALYSDSKTAMSRVQQGKCKTSLAPQSAAEALFTVIKRAEKRLSEHQIKVPVLKWNTEER